MQSASCRHFTARQHDHAVLGNCAPSTAWSCLFHAVIAYTFYTHLLSSCLEYMLVRDVFQRRYVRETEAAGDVAVCIKFCLMTGHMPVFFFHRPLFAEMTGE